jgi:hypothetical protein
MKKMSLFVLLLLIPFAASAYEFCSSGERGAGLEIISFNDTLRGNANEWIWDWEESIEIDVEVQNNLAQDGDFTAELIFIDSDESEVYVAVNNGDLSESVSLESNETETLSFNFNVERGVIENVYDFYIKFYKDADQAEECEETSREITIGSLIFCENGQVDESDLKIKSVSDNNKDNDNDWDWSIGDDIELEVTVDNKDYGDMHFDVELVFVDDNGDEISFAATSGDLSQNVEIKEDTSEDITFNFTVGDEVNSETYGFYVVATSDEDSDICTSVRAYGSNIIEVKVGGDYGIIVSSVSGLSTVDAGSTENYSVIIKNLGTSMEGRVLAVAYNSNLGVREEYLISNLAAGVSKTVVFEIDFPENSAGTSERIAFFADYDYDENRDYYLSASSDGGFDKSYLVAINNIPSIELINTTTEDFNLSINSTRSSGSGLFSSSGKSLFWIIWIVAVVLVVIFIVFYFLMRKKSSNNYYPSINSAKY